MVLKTLEKSKYDPHSAPRQLQMRQNRVEEVEDGVLHTDTGLEPDP